MNYSSFALWCYILFFNLWSGGRSLVAAFSVVYTLDMFHRSITQIAGLNLTTNVINIGMLFLFGRYSDKWGHRRPLMVISGVVGSAMLLFISSAWWGIVPLIIMAVVNGFAGYSHNMLAMNLALYIFPEKGRSAYMSFCRFFTGLGILLTPILGGSLMHVLRTTNFQYPLWGATLNDYHVIFLIGVILSTASVIPLWILGNRKVEDLAGE